MNLTRRLLERVAPQSVFSLTLVTIVVLALIVGFFARGIYLVSVEGRPRDGSNPFADRGLMPWPGGSAIRLGPGESYRTEPADDAALAESDPELPDDLIVPANPKIASLTESRGIDALVNPPQRRSASPAVSPGCAALLTRTCDCRWTGDAENPMEGAQFKVGQTLNIAAGLVEIVFGCGAKAVLEGPAVLELQSGKSGALRVGKLTADVPDGVEGFTVQTPTAQLVSLCASEQKGVAKLTAAIGCRWAEGNSVAKEGACLLPGQAVKLLAGLAEITFQSGAKVILEGPATLEIESPKTATLQSGRMTADVPDELEGFRIRTAAVEILSLPAETKKSNGNDDAKEKSPAA